jgi:hypothetical protein
LSMLDQPNRDAPIRLRGKECMTRKREGDSELEIEDGLASIVGRSIKDVAVDADLSIDVFFDVPSDLPTFLRVEEAAWRVMSRGKPVASWIDVAEADFNSELHAMLVGLTVLKAAVNPRSDLTLALDDGLQFEVCCMTTDVDGDWSLFLPAGVVFPSQEGFGWEPGREAW